VLIAEVTGARVKRLQELSWGRMFCFRKVRPYKNERWGFDNGAFFHWTRHTPFDGDAFLARLAAARECTSEPFLAVTPDIVAAGERSLEFSLGWLDRLPVDWPSYLAVQDGMSPALVSSSLRGFAGVFLGGTDKLKLQAQTWCDLAHEQGKRFHYGRASTLRRLRHAMRIAADSLDTSFPLWTEERFREFAGLWLEGDRNRELFA
jgi:hypothetical protein